MSLVNAPVLGINLKKNANPNSVGYGKFYPEVSRQKTLTTRGFAEHMISHGSKYGLEDIVAILRMFSTCLPELLAMGIGVKFDGLGCFLPYAQSKKGITKAEMAGITPAEIVKAIHIRFLPDSTKLDNLAGPAFADRCSMEIQNVVVVERIKDAEAAQAVTDHAFRTILANMSSFKNERALGLALDYEMQRASDGDLAFPTIVAGGENACCLHYVKKDEPLKAGELVLLDFGIRIGTLHSDISRTIPVSGKFNPLQKMLYEIVLDSATEYQKAVRPGVPLKEIGNIPWDFIMRELEARLVKGCKGKFKLLYDKRPHGVRSENRFTKVNPAPARLKPFCVREC